MKSFLEIFDRLRFLAVEMKQINIKMESLFEGTFCADDYEQLDVKDGELYQEYFDIIHKTFNKAFIDEVVSQVGNGKFTSAEFTEAMWQAYKTKKGIIDIYEGFILRCAEDCWDGTSYFVYDQNGHQYSEGLDFCNDESAIKEFRYAMDHNMLDSIGLD